MGDDVAASFAPAEVAPLVCGHRGMPAGAPENSLPGFALAGSNGASWIEFDVRPCADQLVVHHDPVTATARHIATTPRDELGSDIASLEQVIEAFGPTMGLDIELKTDDIGIALDEFVDRTLQTLADAAELVDLSHVLVTSFDQRALSLVRAGDSGVSTGLIFHKRSMDWAIAAALAEGHSAVVPWYPLVTAAGVERAHSNDLLVATWTVNTTGQVRSVAADGVDMIIGDDSALIVRSLAHR